MNRIEKRGEDYIGYDYQEIPANGRYTALLLDGYERLGWQIDGTAAGETIRLKRARKIINKVELTRLQRHFDACVDELNALEQSRTAAATAAALALGLVGTALVAVGVLFAAASTPDFFRSTLAGLPGIGCWVAAPLTHKALVARRAPVVDRLTEKKYDEIEEICKKGDALRRDG